MLPKVILFAAVLFAAPARATSVVLLDPVEQAAESTAIVDAVVGDAVQVDDLGHTFTDTDLVVREVLAGAAPARFRLRQMKGVRPDGARFFVIGDAELAPGERIVAFVREVEGRWYLTALAQSVWHVREDGTVWRDLDGLSLFARTERGVVPADESPSDPETVDELRAALSGLRGEVGR